MSEYIKREDVIMEISADNSLSSHDSVDRFSIIDRMKRIPAADVEPVVRGEWKWYDRKEAETYVV